MAPLRVSIGGDIGSGKSTAAKRVAALAGVEVLSTGQIQRAIAAEKGMTTLELNRLADIDPTIDQEIDGYLQRMPLDAPVVVESRLGWHFTPNTLKVYLYVSDHEAARRIRKADRADESYASDSKALDQIILRRNSERERFIRKYGVNIDDLRNYDVVIDTTLASADEVFHKIIDHHPAGHQPVCWLDPKNLLPTEPVREVDSDTIQRMEKEFGSQGMGAELSTSCAYVEHAFFVLDGHARVASALRAGVDFVPAYVAAVDDEPFQGGPSAREHVAQTVTNALVHDWEAAFGFRYAEELWGQSHRTPLLRR